MGRQGEGDWRRTGQAGAGDPCPAGRHQVGIFLLFHTALDLEGGDMPACLPTPLGKGLHKVQKGTQNLQANNPTLYLSPHASLMLSVRQAHTPLAQKKTGMPLGRGDRDPTPHARRTHTLLSLLSEEHALSLPGIQ